MSDELKKLLETAKAIEMSPADQEQQRRSFAYGNTSFENRRITRETIDKAADNIKPANG